MKRINNIFFALVFLCSLAAAQGTISVDSHVDKAEILIGDVFNYEVVIRHSEDVTIIPPSLAENLGMFEIRDYVVNPPMSEDGEIVERTRYLLSTFETGKYEIPPLEIGYKVGADTTVQFIKTKPLLINVASLNPDESGDIRDIKPPKVPPRDYARLFVLIALAIVAVAVAIFILYYFKRRKEGKALIPKRQKPPRPAHEVALEALENLVNSELLQTGQVKQYYIELSEIIRTYVEERFYIPALEMTTDQLLSEVERQNMEPDHQALLREFLAACDLVKFAKYVPSKAENEKTTKQAFDFVEETKLVIVSPDSEPAEEEELAAVEENSQEVQ